MRIGFPGLRTTSFGLLCSILLAPPPSALADDPIIYPADGQSAEQQRDDEGQCFVWARDESGFDPLAPPEVDKAAAQQRRGGALRGAAAGAIIGAIVSQAPCATFHFSAPLRPQRICSFFWVIIRTKGAPRICAMSITRFSASICF